MGAGDLPDRLRVQAQNRHALGTSVDAATETLAVLRSPASNAKMQPVTGSWSSLLTTLIPLALVVAVSPLSVIPAVLVLQTQRPGPTSLVFLGGWLLGLTALTAAFVASSDLLGDLHKKPPAWASWLRVALGLALIAYGIYEWLAGTNAPNHRSGCGRLRP